MARKTNILLVDSLPVPDALEWALREEDFQMVSVPRGQKASNKFGEDQTDVALLARNPGQVNGGDYNLEAKAMEGW